MSPQAATSNEKPTSKPRRIIPTAFKLLAFLCALALVPAVNYAVDPSALFVTSRAQAPEIAAAALMLEGCDVTGLAPNYNERLLRREYIMGMEKPARVIVAGSSRGEPISHDMLGLGRGEMFNVGVAGGELEDMLGFVGLLLERGLDPETLVISLDPWTLNDAYTQKRYIGSLSDGVYYMLSELGENPAEAYKWIEPLYDPDAPSGGLGSLPNEVKRTLFSITYFQSSLHYFFGGDYDLYKEVRVSETPDGLTGVVRSDGSYSYALDYREADAAVSTERARRSLPNVLGLENYETLKGTRYERLRLLVEYLKQRGIEVMLVMFPVGNTIYDHMNKPANREHYTNFFACEEMFRDFAAEMGIDIVGGFDPYALGYDMGDFYDGYHLKENRAREIVSRLVFN